MFLLHHPEVELSRTLLATLPVEVDVVDWTAPEHDGWLGNPRPSAFPTVIVDVPAYSEDRPQFNDAGEFQGMARVTVPAHQEGLRMPASWDAVQSFVDAVEDRARTSPATV